MSRAFIKEEAAEAADSGLPDRPVSANRNFVTRRGLEQIDGTIADLQNRLAAAKRDGRADVAAALARDLRYWRARRGSAEIVEPLSGNDVRFGTTVTIRRPDGRSSAYRIVGEDEADPAAGLLSYMAPLARALIGKEEGDDVTFRGESLVVIKIA